MARPFHFKLEKILEYRQQVEDQAKLALSQAVQAVDRQAEVATTLEQALRQCVEEMSSKKQMTQADLWLWTGYRDRLKLDKTQAEAKLERLKATAEQCRQELVAKSMERKLLEKLRAKQAEKHDHDAQSREQKEFDETATLRYGRSPY